MDGNFGQYLRNLRKSKKITLVELAKKTGLSQPYLSQIENNQRGKQPTIEIINTLADGLNVTNVDLLEAAGYISIEKVGYKDEFEGILQEEKELRKKKDILNLLRNEENVYYNNQLISQRDKERALKMLEVLLSEYHD